MTAEPMQDVNPNIVHIDDGYRHISDSQVSGDVGPNIAGRHDDDSHVRCRRCHALLVYDLGDGYFGQPEYGEGCPRCDSRNRTF